MDMFDGTISLDVAMENATETLPVKGVMFHEGYGKGPKLKPDATSNLNDIFGVEFAKQPTPLPAARPQGAKFAVFAEEEEEPAAKPSAKPVAKLQLLQSTIRSYLGRQPTRATEQVLMQAQKQQRKPSRERARSSQCLQRRQSQQLSQ